jgi:hypothetical protein
LDLISTYLEQFATPQKMRSRNLWIITGVLVGMFSFSGCVRGHIGADTAVRAAQEDDIREAIFRYEMKEHRFPDVVFLSINNQEPSEVFMRRFSDVKLSVRNWSAIAPAKEPPQRWISDRETEKPGVALSVGKFRWTSDYAVVVAGGYYCGILCAGEGNFYVTFKDGRWIVEKFDIKAIS